jgi:GT2 family glycosyltransferase
MSLVSVIVPAHNSAEYVADTLDSVLAQTHSELEVIVVDDGSTDSTPEIVASYGDRVRYVRQQNAGVGVARNHGLRFARGNLVAFLDADDLWEPATIETHLAILARAPQSGFVAADGVMFSGDHIVGATLFGRPVRDRIDAAPSGVLTGDVYRDVAGGVPLATVGQALIPRHVLDTVGPFTEDRTETEDWDLWLRITRRFPVTFHRNSLVKYRRTESSASGPVRWRYIRWTLRNIPVIERELRVCPLDARPVLREKLRRDAEDAAVEAYYLGRRGELQRSRQSLYRLWRAVPTSAPVAMRMVALHLPEGSVSWLSQALRRVTPTRH